MGCRKKVGFSPQRIVSPAGFRFPHHAVQHIAVIEVQARPHACSVTVAPGVVQRARTLGVEHARQSRRIEHGAADTGPATRVISLDQGKNFDGVLKAQSIRALCRNTLRGLRNYHHIRRPPEHVGIA